MLVRIANQLRQGSSEPGKVTLDSRDVTYLLRIANVAASQADCCVGFQDKPKGWTCLDQMADAATLSSAYMPEFRAEILSGLHLCDQCRLRAALGE
jgi:hypothetical protein